MLHVTTMAHVNFTKSSCRPVDFMGQGPSLKRVAVVRVELEMEITSMNRYENSMILSYMCS